MIDKVAGASQTQSFTNSRVEASRFNPESATDIQVLERQEEESQQEPVTKEKLQNAIHGMNELLSASSTHVKFEFHEDLKEYYVTIVDNQSNEVIKEIPNKKVLDMFAAMTEFVGLMVDKKA
jgi:flagellar protein FlaG